MNKFWPSAACNRMLTIASLVTGLWTVQILAPSAYAQSSQCTYYVSPSGSDTNGSGSFSAPWQTAQKAFNSVSAGQTVCFRGGVYPSTTAQCTQPTPPFPCPYSQKLITVSGTSSSPIQFINYPGEVAVIQGPTGVGDWSDPAQGVAYVIFQGTSPPGALIFEGPSGNQQDVVDVMYSHDVTFDRVEIRNGDWHAGFYQYRGYNNKLTASYIHNNGRRDPACTDCFNLDNGVYWADTTGAGSLIANNVVEDNVAQGIQLYPTPSSQVTVEENTIVNNGNWGIVVYGSSQAVVNNILYNNGHDPRANNYQGQLAEYSGNTVIDHNVTYDDRGGAYAGWWNTSTCTSNCITNPNTANPTFVNPSASDWHLQSISPVIGWSNASYVQPVDRDGKPRTNPSDPGCYQH